MAAGSGKEILVVRSIQLGREEGGVGDFVANDQS